MAGGQLSITYYDKAAQLLAQAEAAALEGDLQMAIDKAEEAKQGSLSSLDDPDWIYEQSTDLLRICLRELDHPHPSRLRRLWWRLDDGTTRIVQNISRDVIQV
jgi:hypothetical protein